jgi:hypothetical protein
MIVDLVHGLVTLVLVVNAANAATSAGITPELPKPRFLELL